MKTSLIRMMTAGVLLTAGAWASAQFEPVDPPAPGGGQGALPEIVATVDGEPITREVYAQALAATTRRLQASPQAQQQGITQLNPEQRRMVLDSLISNRIALALASRAGIEVDEDEVQEFIDREEARFPSPETFDTFLSNEGIDRDVMRERTREMLRIQGFREHLTADVEITDEEVRAQYEEMRDAGRLNAPKTWDFRHILLKADPNIEGALMEVEEDVYAVRERIEGGEDFAAVAEELSDDLNSRENGGLYRNVPRGRGIFDDEFESHAFEVEVGQLSEPFSTRMGWHLVKMEAVHEAGLMSFERVVDSLTEQLLAQKQQARFQERLMDSRDEIEVRVLVDLGGPPPQQQGGSAIDDLLRQLDDGS